MASFPNRYADDCAGCGARVPPSAPGRVVGRTFREHDRWVTRCLPCAQQVAAAPPDAVPAPPPARCRVWPDAARPGHVLVAATTFFGDTAFANFKVACSRAGASTFNDPRTSKVLNRAPASALPHLVAYLGDAGIEVELDPALAAQLQDRALAARAAAASADERIRRISAELATRTSPVTGLPEKLLGFQGPGIVVLAEHVPGGILLADQPGLGKTVSSLLALDPMAPCFVLTRSSVVNEWIKAIRRWTPARRAGTYEGSGGRGTGLTYWPQPGQILVGSYEVLSDHPPADCPEGMVAIVDEAHNFKGAGTARDRKWKLHRDAILAKRGTIYPLTGTPLVNDDLDELWTVLQVAGLGVREFGTKRRFLSLAQRDPAEFARRLRNVMLRRLKREVLADLPPVLHATVPCEITDEVRQELDAALAAIVDLAVARSEDQARKDAAALRALDADQLAEVVAVARANARANVLAAIDLVFDGTIRPPFELIARVKSILALAKIPASLEKLDALEAETPRGADGLWSSPILFFSAHVEPVRRVATRPGWAALTGDTPQGERARLIDALQEGRLAGLALTSKAGGEGVTLTRADRIVRNDREWTPAANEQTVGRAWRYGQDSAVQVFDVTARHALDERILERNAEKEALNDQTVERAVTRLTEPRQSLADRLEATLAGVELRPTTARTVVQHWIARGLLLLARLAPAPVGVRIDGATRPDAQPVADLAARVRDPGLTVVEWERARRLLGKYRRQIGECP